MFRFIAAALIWLTLAAGAAAQTTPDYTAWEDVATRAEAAVEAARASDDAFAVLRAEVAEWRAEFQDAQNVNATRLETLRGQLAALGDAPAEGESEATEVAARRAELTDQIQRLEAPRRTAEEAFSRANGIIGEIDQIVRDRQAERLFELGPTPINPALWLDAWQAQLASWRDLGTGIVDAWSNPATRAEAQGRWPGILALLSIALVLVMRARSWIERLAQRIEAMDDTRRTSAAGFVVSLGQVVVPVLGLVALGQAIELTGFYGSRGEQLIALLPQIGLAIFGSRWLAGRLLPGTPDVETPLTIPMERHAGGRYLALLLGVLLAIDMVVQAFADIDNYDAGASAVLFFPVTLVAGVVLWRLGRLLRVHAPGTDADGNPQVVFFDRLLSLLGRALSLVGIAAPVIAAIGYTNAAAGLIWPTVLSLGLIALLVLLQEFLIELYAVFARRGAAVEDALTPVLGGFVLILCSLPVFSLIWGARLTDLAELWTRFQAGVTIGQTTISPGSFLTLLIVFAIGYALTRFVQGALKTSVLPKTQLDVGGQTAITSGLGYVGIFLAALVAISAAGLDLSSLAIVAGALSVGIGFGLQTVVSNFVSGIILLIERPISEGDWIEVGGNMGYVRDISVRSTRIETFDRTDVIVPNADLISGTVTNYTRGNSVGRVIVPVGVAYGTDTRKVEAILREVAEGHPMVLLRPPPAVVFMNFGADALEFEIRAILRDVNWVMSVKSDMNHEIVKRFAAADIEIPYAQRDIWLRNPEALKTVVHDMERDDAGDDEDGGDADGGG
ncbi:MAG: DUF3772 domain-containing protein [Pseudomonadota bacterium]